MGRRTSNANANANKPAVNEFATATIKGVVSDFYGDGKKYDYVTVDVHHDYDDYYDRFRVAVNKNYDVPDDGEPIELVCNIKTYKGDISFKEIHADDTNK